MLEQTHRALFSYLAGFRIHHERPDPGGAGLKRLSSDSHPMVPKRGVVKLARKLCHPVFTDAISRVYSQALLAFLSELFPGYFLRTPFKSTRFHESAAMGQSQRHSFLFQDVQKTLK